MKTYASMLVLAATLLAGRALAQPAPEPQESPSPTPATSPVEPATPTPVASPAPTVTPEPTPPPPVTPAATPAVEAAPMAEPEIVVAPQRNWRAGTPNRPAGIRPWRGLAAASGHVFLGNGWNRDAKLPDEDPPKSTDYAGGGMRIGALYEVNPRIALGATLGGHQGTHQLEEEAGTAAPVTVSYGLYYAGASARLQTVPGPAGFYVEAGGGFAAGRVTITRANDAEDEDEDQLTPTVMGYAALGGTGNISQGVDLFFEVRWMTAPDAADSFTSDDDLDLGGLTGSVGILVRL